MDPTELWPAPDRRERWLRFMALLGAQPGERILDVGFGRGEALRFVGRLGRRVGVEPSVGPVARLKDNALAKGAGRVDGLIADAQSLPFAEESFDAVLCVNVLEAVPDRARALAEMRRVLKLGGRILLAHDDYGSQVYACTDRELGQRVVRAYAEATFATYATSDGQMGRHLWGLFRAAGFRDPELRVLPLVNTEYREPLQGWVLAQFPASLVVGVSDLTQEELDRWRADLAERGARGAYVYCLDVYCCLGRK